MEICTRVHANNLVRWAKRRPKAVVFSADLTSSVELDAFRAAYPDRFFSFGVAEQNMLSMAGGMAREGFYPLVHTFGVFLYRRAYDQLAMSIAYPNLPVRLFGFLPGITTPGGASHQAIEDVAILRALPNMTVLDCGDATDVESVLDVADAVPGPVYVRMLRGEIPRLFAREEPMRLDRCRVLERLPASGVTLQAKSPSSRADSSPGGREADVALLSSSICTEEAMRATAVLQARGVKLRHLHVSTLKPFTDPEIIETIAAARHGAITMENHVLTGGLGSAVAERMAEAGLAKRLVRIGLRDTFAHGASRHYLMREYEFDAIALVARVQELLGTDFRITAEELAEVRLEAVHCHSKAEAL